MSEYVFGDPAWNRERERLAMLEEWIDPVSQRRLDALGVRPGMRCLEVGAGSGSIAEWLAERVGPAGHVLALDIDTRFLDGIDSPTIEVRRGDVTTEDLPAGAFDLVHARALVHHLPDPRATIERLLGCLAPGGRILLEDPDVLAAVVSPHVAWRRAWEALLALPGLDVAYGRRLPADLRAAGAEDVDAEIEVHLVRGGTRLAEFQRLSTVALRDALIATGKVTGEELDGLARETEDPDFQEPGFAWVAASGKGAS